MGPRARLAAAPRQVVRRRPAERQRQLPGPPPARPTAHQGGPRLGRRAGRPAHADLLRPVPRGLRLRLRAAVARRQKGRSGRAVHAARAGARHCNAGMRAHRRSPQRRVRRFQRRGVARPDQRRAGARARDRRRRLSPWPDRRAQARGRRRARRDAVDRARRGRPAGHRRSHAGPHDAGARPLVPRADGGRLVHLPARGDGRGGHALHPLHVRHDGEAQGHRAHHGGLPGRHLRHDEARLRSPRRGRVLVHGRHRLGHGTQLPGLRSARQRCDRAHVRRRAGLAGQGPVLVAHRASRRHDLLHGADRDPHVHALGHRVARAPRSVVAPAARLRGRTDQPRGVGLVLQGHRRGAVSRRRHVVADGNGGDHDRPAPRGHHAEARVGHQTLPGDRGRDPDRDGRDRRRRRRSARADAAVAFDAARDLRRPRSLRAPVPGASGVGTST